MIGSIVKSLAQGYIWSKGMKAADAGVIKTLDALLGRKPQGEKGGEGDLGAAMAALTQAVQDNTAALTGAGGGAGGGGGGGSSSVLKSLTGGPPSPPSVSQLTGEGEGGEAAAKVAPAIGKNVSAAGVATTAKGAAGAAAGEGAGAAAGVLGRLGPMLANPVVAVTAGLVAVGYACAKAVPAIKEMGEGLVNSYRGLERFHGGIAVMMAQFDRQSLLLAGRYASATGGTASAAGQKTMRLREEMAPLTNALGNIKNVAVGVLVDVARGLVAIGRVILGPVELIGKFCEKCYGAGGNEAPPIQGFLNFLKAGPVNKHPRDVGK